jgi:hypothetical protein
MVNKPGDILQVFRGLHIPGCIPKKRSMILMEKFFHRLSDIPYAKPGPVAGIASGLIRPGQDDFT